MKKGMKGTSPENLKWFGQVELELWSAECDTQARQFAHSSCTELMAQNAVGTFPSNRIATQKTAGLAPNSHQRKFVT